MIPGSDAVFVESEKLDGVRVSGDVQALRNLDSFIDHFKTSGFQASNLGLAIEEVNRMLMWRLSDEPFNPDVEGDEWEDLTVRKTTRCKIWLSFTSNMISSGVRELLVFLAKHKLVDVFCTSAGGVEEDLIKCLGDTYLGDFNFKGKDLRPKGWNRIGNLLLPNENYCKFEEWLQPLLDEMLVQQESAGMNWTPSKMIKFLGERINDESSLLYWCAKNDIPIFCPGITDGSLGDNLYFHSYRNPGLRIDVVEDIRRVTEVSIACKKSGIIVLGGGIAKHHICNANMFRNGADFAVYMSTAQEFDGCDSGARPDEAVSWGKIRLDAKPVKVFVEATIGFPLLVAGSFMRYVKDF
ncbi:MAG: uncharacterized protein KVP18_000749 [Porospora cf. gigantea A]|uniref:uncharacterized protein n=1 Tax=Porospora cf. gigantea A TaxID=2853593 RepID=UPI00355A339A|nr:MAG: hypothetical protein KVP18_000749 [Porospora cf. gigantea A]